MLRSMVVLIGVVVAASIARAGAVVELVPDQPGPYMGGESLTVDVWLSLDQDYPFDVRLRVVQLDFSETDPALALDPEFSFDFSSIPPPNGYLATTYPDLPVPWTVNLLECYSPDYFFLLPEVGALRIWSIGVDLPTDPGVYAIDALNADAPDAFNP